jgi:hypothetical protein
MARSAQVMSLFDGFDGLTQISLNSPSRHVWSNPWLEGAVVKERGEQTSAQYGLNPIRLEVPWRFRFEVPVDRIIRVSTISPVWLLLEDWADLAGTSVLSSLTTSRISQ